MKCKQPLSECRIVIVLATSQLFLETDRLYVRFQYKGVRNDDNVSEF